MNAFGWCMIGFGTWYGLAVLCSFLLPARPRRGDVSRETWADDYEPWEDDPR